MKWSTTDVWFSDYQARGYARSIVRVYAICHPEFKHLLTPGERQEQYADEYARAIMRFCA